MAGASITTKKRLLVILLFYFLAVVALIGRLAYLQIVRGDELQKKAFQQQQMGRTISPARGIIYDRNGRELAISASVNTISAKPNENAKLGKPIETIAEGLAEILDLNKEDIIKKLSRNTQYEYIKRRIDKEIGDKVREWIEKERI